MHKNGFKLPSIMEKDEELRQDKQTNKIKKLYCSNIKKDRRYISQVNQNNYINNINNKYSKSRKADPISILALASTKPTPPSRSLQEYHKLTQLQSNIIMQIKNIDVHLQSQKNNQKQSKQIKIFNSLMFIKNVNEMVIQQFHECIKIQSENSKVIVQGFDVERFIYDNDGEVNIIQAKIVKQVNSIHHNLLNKSINSIKEYERKKESQCEKNCGKEWSLYKRIKTEAPSAQNEEDDSVGKKYNLQRPRQESKISELKKSFIKKRESHSTKLFQSKLTCLSKNSFLNESSVLNRSKNEVSESKYITAKTQPSERVKNDVVVNLTKKDVNNMLKKHKNIVSIWMPPASYPQFFGLFTYKIVKIETKTQIKHTYYRCKLTKYFFYKFSLDKKVFDAILQWAGQQTQHSIQELQITVEKSIYNKIFANFGWVLKYWQSHNKVKAIYSNSNTNLKK